MKTILWIGAGLLVLCCFLPMLAGDVEPTLAQGPRSAWGTESVSGGNDRPAEAGGACCFVVLGDCSRDGIVTALDVHLVAMAYYAEKDTDRYDWRADVDCSGTVDYNDLKLVLMALCQGGQ